MPHLDIHAVLKQHWGYDVFRPLQEDIITSILNGNDTLALLPTGGGKSLIYWVSAKALKGTCLVISPLIALIDEQAEKQARSTQIEVPTLHIYRGKKPAIIKQIKAFVTTEII